jgi:hypothetical protein
MVRFSPKETGIGEIIAAIQDAGYGISDLSTDERTLEDVFLKLTR